MLGLYPSSLLQEVQTPMKEAIELPQNPLGNRSLRKGASGGYQRRPIGPTTFPMRPPTTPLVPSKDALNNPSPLPTTTLTDTTNANEASVGSIRGRRSADATIMGRKNDPLADIGDQNQRISKSTSHGTSADGQSQGTRRLQASAKMIVPLEGQGAVLAVRDRHLEGRSIRPRPKKTEKAREMERKQRK